MAKRKYDLEIKIAHNIRKLEIGLLWKRAWLFWGFTVAGFIGYAYFFNNADYEKALIVANFGFISAFIWTLVNRGSKFWQDFWDTKIVELEPKALEYTFFQGIYKPKSRGVWSGVRFSPSRLIIALSDYVAVSWFLLLLGQAAIIIGGMPPPEVIGKIAFALMGATLLYALWVYFETKQHND